MIKRIVEIGNPARLHFENQQIVIESLTDKDRTASIPVEDLGVLILDNSRIQCSPSVYSACLTQNVAVVHCDEKHLPVGMLIPFEGHSLHSKILRLQMDLSEPRRKKAWQTIIQEKIKAQAACLKKCRGNDEHLSELIQRVKSGDPDNIEAQAARKYWPLLYSIGFKRDRDQPGINSLLNYVYAVLRASVCRACVGSGLNPALGLHHNNQYNAFALADDLMEPLRPWIDEKVFDYIQTEPECLLDTKAKQVLLKLLTENVEVNGLEFPFFVALTHYTSSLAKYYAGERETLEFPSR